MKVSLMALSFGLFLVVGLPLAASAGPVPGVGADGDGDTIEDAFDNCTAVVNADQADSDHDGCGDPCDPPTDCDANGDNAVGLPDFQLFVAQQGNDCNANPSLDCSSDCADAAGTVGVEDGLVGLPDFQAFVAQQGNVNGPSGITNPSRIPEECPN